MYLPTTFAQTDPRTLHDFIEAHSFGLLVSDHGGKPFATHLPFLLERDTGPHGTLVAHLARANPQWHDLNGRSVLAVFSGPHAYVSPTWYEADDVVPTWNYVAVHAYGTFRLVEETDEVAAILTRLVATYEVGMPAPWSIDARSDYFTKLARAVVGFRVEITRLEGKWKLNQNQPRQRRERVIQALLRTGGADETTIADLMAQSLREPGRENEPGPASQT